MDQSIALEEWMCDLRRADSAFDCLEFGRCREVVGPMVKADEQTSSRLLEDELRAIAALCDGVSDHLVRGGR